MRRSGVAVLLALAAAVVGCGKGEFAVVKRPVLPISLCWIGSGGKTGRPCEHPFDAGQLISLRLDAAERLAKRHDYTLRVIAPPANQFLTLDLGYGRIDVECAEVAENCIVTRIVEQG